MANQRDSEYRKWILDNPRHTESPDATPEDAAKAAWKAGWSAALEAARIKLTGTETINPDPVVETESEGGED